MASASSADDALLDPTQAVEVTRDDGDLVNVGEVEESPGREDTAANLLSVDGPTSSVMASSPSRQQDHYGKREFA